MILGNQVLQEPQNGNQLHYEALRRHWIRKNTAFLFSVAVTLNVLGTLLYELPFAYGTSTKANGDIVIRLGQVIFCSAVSCTVPLLVYSWLYTLPNLTYYGNLVQADSSLIANYKCMGRSIAGSAIAVIISSFCTLAVSYTSQMTQIIIDLYFIVSLSVTLTINLVVVEIVWRNVARILKNVNNLSESCPNLNPETTKSLVMKRIEALSRSMKVNNVHRRNLRVIVVSGWVILTLYLILKFKYIYLFLNVYIIFVDTASIVTVVLVAIYTVILLKVLGTLVH